MIWPALFAAVDDTWIKVIIAIVGVAIYVINHLASGLKKPAAGKPPRMPPARPLNPQQQQQPIPAEPVTQRRQELNTELSDFLRRAAQKRGEAQPSGSLSSSPSQPAQVAAQPTKSQRKRRKAESSSPAQPACVEEPKRRGLSSLDTSAIEGRGAQLSHLANADEIQERVQGNFDRQLGNIASNVEAAASIDVGSPEQQIEATQSAADGLFALLRDPQSLRGAIILNEIMARPEDRW